MFGFAFWIAWQYPGKVWIAVLIEREPRATLIVTVSPLL